MKRPIGLLTGSNDHGGEEIPQDFLRKLEDHKDPSPAFYSYVRNDIDPNQASTFLKIRERDLTMCLMALRGADFNTDNIEGWGNAELRAIWEEYELGDKDPSDRMRAVFLGTYAQSLQAQIGSFNTRAEGRMDAFQSKLESFRQSTDQVWARLEELGITGRTAAELQPMIALRTDSLNHFQEVLEGRTDLNPDRICSFPMRPAIMSFYEQSGLNKLTPSDEDLHDFVHTLYFIAEYEVQLLNYIATQNAQENAAGDAGFGAARDDFRSRAGGATGAGPEREAGAARGNHDEKMDKLRTLAGLATIDNAIDQADHEREMAAREAAHQRRMDIWDRTGEDPGPQHEPSSHGSSRGTSASYSFGGGGARVVVNGVEFSSGGVNTGHTSTREAVDPQGNVRLSAGQTLTVEELRPGCKVRLSGGSQLTVMDDATDVDFSLSGGSQLSLRGYATSSVFNLSGASTVNVQGDAIDSSVFLSGVSNFNLRGDNINTRIVR